MHPCRTVGATMLHLWCQGAALLLALLFESLYMTFDDGIAMLDCWYSYAVLLVYLCCTVGIAMLDLWYQNASLFWYRFFI